MTFKGILKKIFDEYLVALIAVLGLPLIAYGVWFQTEGFRYIGIMPCFYALLIGAAIAFLIMRFIGSQKLAGKELSKMMTGYTILFLLCFLSVYRAVDPMLFLISVGGMTFSFVTDLFYFIWKLKAKKKESEAAAK